MTDSKLIDMGCPGDCIALARTVVEDLKRYNRGVDAELRIDIDEAIQMCINDAEYVFYEGGSDGTFGHMDYHQRFGKVHKSLLALAEDVVKSLEAQNWDGLEITEEDAQDDAEYEGRYPNG